MQKLSLGSNHSLVILTTLTLGTEKMKMATKVIEAVFVFFPGMKIITDPKTGRQKFGSDTKVDFNKLLDLYFDPFK